MFSKLLSLASYTASMLNKYVNYHNPDTHYASSVGRYLSVLHRKQATFNLTYHLWLYKINIQDIPLIIILLQARSQSSFQRLFTKGDKLSLPFFKMPTNNTHTSKAAFKRQVQLTLFQMLRNIMHEGNTELTSTSLSLHNIWTNQKNPAKMALRPAHGHNW